jgi:hypothetical protein
MTVRKPKMTELSKPAEILYRAFFDELRVTKQQQWTITNYALLLMGALFGVVKLGSRSPSPDGKMVWSLLVVVVVGGALWMLLTLQSHLRRTRHRQQQMELTFNAEDRRLVDPPEPRPRREWFVVILCSVVIGAGVLVGYAVWQL